MNVKLEWQEQNFDAQFSKMAEDPRLLIRCSLDFDIS
jgi:hypothetical protein